MLRSRRGWTWEISHIKRPTSDLNDAPFQTRLDVGISQIKVPIQTQQAKGNQTSHVDHMMLPRHKESILFFCVNYGKNRFENSCWKKLMLMFLGLCSLEAELADILEVTSNYVFCRGWGWSMYPEFTGWMSDCQTLFPNSELSGMQR